MQVKGPILYFFLLVLEIPLNLGLNVSHKQSRFSEILLEKSLEFVLSRGNGIVAFNLSFVLLLAEVNPVLEKWGHKRDAFVTRGSSHVEMIFTLLTKVIALHIQALIVKVRVSGLKKAIPECGICLKLVMFLAFDK